MAGTPVRTVRESLVLGIAQHADVAAKTVSLQLSEITHSAWARVSTLKVTGAEGRFDRTEALFGLFVALQVAEFIALAASERLDFPVAAFLSASLVTIACLVSRHREEVRVGASALNAQVSKGGAVIATSASVAAHANRGALRSAIDEGSVPWADLMGRISHEIRTPLNAVIGFSDLMGREIFGPLGHPRYADYAAHIKESGEALLKSAEDTLALSALLAMPTHGMPTQTSSVSAVIEDAWRQLAPVAERRSITLVCTIDAELDVTGDRRAIRQIVSNLMNEALNRAADGRIVAVSARSVGSVVRLDIGAPHCGAQRRQGDPSLAVCIASALLVQLDAPFVTEDGGIAGPWVATTQLERVVQADFFRV
jgi:signal transduction histidine kinase